MSKKRNAKHGVSAWRRAMVAYLASHGITYSTAQKNEELAGQCMRLLGLRFKWKTQEGMSAMAAALPKAPRAKPVARAAPQPDKQVSGNFYESREWRAVRYFALKANDGKCELCGASKATGAVLHVDHILPRSKWPKLQLEPSNLQVLCADCNLGKSNKDDTDWRRAAVA